MTDTVENLVEDFQTHLRNNGTHPGSEPSTDWSKGVMWTLDQLNEFAIHYPLFDVDARQAVIAEYEKTYGEQRTQLNIARTTLETLQGIFTSTKEQLVSGYTSTDIDLPARARWLVTEVRRLTEENGRLLTERGKSALALRKAAMAALNHHTLEVGYVSRSSGSDPAFGVEISSYDDVAEQVSKNFFPPTTYAPAQCRWYFDDKQCPAYQTDDGDYCPIHVVLRVKELGTREARFENYEPCREYWPAGAQLIGECGTDLDGLRSGTFVAFSTSDCELVEIIDDRDDSKSWIIRRTVKQLPAPAKELRTLLNDLDEKWWSRRA